MLQDTLGAAGFIRADKDMQAVTPVPQNIIAAPAYNDAGLLFRQLPDDPGLGKVDHIGGVFFRGVTPAATHDKVP